MIVFIPTAFCFIKDVSREVLEGVIKQNCTPYIFSISDFSEDKIERFRCIAKVRQKIIDFAQKLNEKYVVMSDYDIVHKRNNLKDMKTFLEKNKDFGGVGLTLSEKDQKIEKDHIPMYCVMFRLKAIDCFDATPIGGFCECLSVSKNIRKKWRYGFLESKNNGRIEHNKI